MNHDRYREVIGMCQEELERQKHEDDPKRPTPITASCPECGCSELRFALDCTEFYYVKDAMDGKLFASYEGQEPTLREDNARLFCGACLTYFEMPEDDNYDLEG